MKAKLQGVEHKAENVPSEYCMILDTTIVVDLLRGEETAIRKLKELETQHIPMSTTSITLFEIEQGMTERQREKILSLWKSLNILSFDAAAAQEAGTIHRALKKNGQLIDPEDSMIAGIALVQHEAVITRNLKHFERIPSLKVESY